MMREKIKCFFRTGMGFYIGLFVCAYLGARAYNALRGSRFALEKLADLCRCYVGAYSANDGLITPIPTTE